MNTTVYIVDDDSAVRDSLALLLSLKGYATRTFDSAEAFLGAVSPDWTGCALVDLRMPGMSGLELQSELIARRISLPLIFVTAHGDISATRHALKSGALDLLEKPIDDNELLEAVRLACERDSGRRRSEGEILEFKARLARLTPREREVLERVVAGEHNREIARALGISARTVEVYKSRLMEKLQVERIPELVRAMVGAGVGPP